jgi:DNA-binding IclR family transcriptional regulator
VNRIRDRIVGRVDSGETKVALLTLLAHQPQRWFSSGALTRYLRLPQSEIDRLLRGLVDDGFLECSRGEGEPLYRLTTHPEVRQAVLHLARLGQRGRISHARVVLNERQRA